MAGRRERGARNLAQRVGSRPGAATAWRNPECDEVLVVSGSGDLSPAASDIGWRRIRDPCPGARLACPTRERCPFAGQLALPIPVSDPRRGRTPEADSTIPAPVVRFEDQPTERGRRPLVGRSGGREGRLRVTQFVGFIPWGARPTISRIRGGGVHPGRRGAFLVRRFLGAGRPRLGRLSPAPPTPLPGEHGHKTAETARPLLPRRQSGRSLSPGGSSAIAAATRAARRGSPASARPLRRC